MTGERKPDRFTRGVRFGCGALLGVGVGVWVAFDVVDDAPVFFGVVAVVTVSVGLASMFFGNHFWQDRW